MFGQEKSDFNHYKQMDSQEFLNTLLDSLHEDLNSNGHLKLCGPPKLPPHIGEERVAAESFQHYRKQNDSVISSLFTVSRQTQRLVYSKTVCLICLLLEFIHII